MDQVKIIIPAERLAAAINKHLIPALLKQDKPAEEKPAKGA